MLTTYWPLVYEKFKLYILPFNLTLTTNISILVNRNNGKNKRRGKYRKSKNQVKRSTFESIDEEEDTVMHESKDASKLLESKKISLPIGPPRIHF